MMKKIFVIMIISTAITTVVMIAIMIMMVAFTILPYLRWIEALSLGQSNSNDYKRAQLL